MGRPDWRNVTGWTLVTIAGAAGLAVVVVADWAASSRWPTAGAVANASVLSAIVSSWVTGRNLRAELEAVRARLDTYNGSESHEALAEARSGGDDLDPPEWVSSGYLPPGNVVDPLAFTASVGREHAAVRPPAMTGERDIDAQDRELTDVYGIGDASRHPPYGHVSRGFGPDPFAPACGCPLAPCGLVEPRDGCEQHGWGSMRTIRQGHPVEECLSVDREIADPLCQNCRLSARWAWTAPEGYPLAACDYCVDLWWPNGIDLLTVRDLGALADWADRLAAVPGCVWASCPHPDRCTSRCRWETSQGLPQGRW